MAAPVTLGLNLNQTTGNMNPITTYMGPTLMGYQMGSIRNYNPRDSMVHWSLLNQLINSSGSLMVLTNRAPTVPGYISTLIAWLPLISAVGLFIAPPSKKNSFPPRCYPDIVPLLAVMTYLVSEVARVILFKNKFSAISLVSFTIFFIAQYHRDKYPKFYNKVMRLCTISSIIHLAQYSKIGALACAVRFYPKPILARLKPISEWLYPPQKFLDFSSISAESILKNKDKLVFNLESYFHSPYTKVGEEDRLALQQLDDLSTKAGSFPEGDIDAAIQKGISLREENFTAEPSQFEFEQFSDEQFYIFEKYLNAFCQGYSLEGGDGGDPTEEVIRIGVKETELLINRFYYRMAVWQRDQFDPSETRIAKSQLLFDRAFGTQYLKYFGDKLDSVLLAITKIFQKIYGIKPCQYSELIQLMRQVIAESDTDKVALVQLVREGVFGFPEGSLDD